MMAESAFLLVKPTVF